VKNVTGYDLCKLLAGSYGTLAALEEVTVKVLPRPETEATVRVSGIASQPAVRLMTAALGSPHEVSGAAYLPAERSVALRVEGPGPSVAFRSQALRDELASGSGADIVGDAQSQAMWRSIGSVAPLADLPGRAVWRVSVAPSRGAELAEAIGWQLDTAWFLDWGGGLVWLAVPEEGDGGAAIVRSAVAGAGHATLVKASPALRRAVAVFEPQAPALAALSRRVKEAFDPRHILNPGRMVEGV